MKKRNQQTKDFLAAAGISLTEPADEVTPTANTEEVSQSSAKKDGKYKCYHCPYEAPSNGNWRRHMKQQHKITPGPLYPEKCSKCQYPGCGLLFYQQNLMFEHMVKEHGYKMNVEKMSFKNINDFITWKQNVEHQHSVRFTIAPGPKRVPQIRKPNNIEEQHTFKCHLSKKQNRKEVPDSLRQRKRRSDRMIQNDIPCPAKMVLNLMKDGTADVEYRTTHNHPIQPLPPKYKIRKRIWEKKHWRDDINDADQGPSEIACDIETANAVESLEVDETESETEPETEPETEFETEHAPERNGSSPLKDKDVKSWLDAIQNESQYMPDKVSTPVSDATKCKELKNKEVAAHASNTRHTNKKQSVISKAHRHSASITKSNPTIIVADGDVAGDERPPPLRETSFAHSVTTGCSVADLSTQLSHIKALEQARGVGDDTSVFPQVRNMLNQIIAHYKSQK